MIYCESECGRQQNVSTDQGQVGEQVGDQGQVGEQSRQRWQEPWERNWECWQNSKTSRTATEDLQIITKVELHRFLPCHAQPRVAQRFSEDAYHGKLHPVLVVWGREVWEGAVYTAAKGQFCNITSMDCYPRWSISQNFPGNRGVQCSAEDIRWNGELHKQKAQRCTSSKL